MGAIFLGNINLALGSDPYDQQPNTEEAVFVSCRAPFIIDDLEEDLVKPGVRDLDKKRWESTMATLNELLTDKKSPYESLKECLEHLSKGVDPAYNISLAERTVKDITVNDRKTAELYSQMARQWEKMAEKLSEKRCSAIAEKLKQSVEKYYKLEY